MFRNYIFVINILILFSLIFGCTSTSNATSNAPDWISYETINNIFPENDFLARIGSGTTPYSAKLNADSELSSYFNQNIKSTTLAEDNYYSKNNSTTSNKTLTRTVTISTDSELIGIKHTDSFFNKQESLYYICTYINRKEAWNLIEPKLKSQVINFENAKRSSERENEELRKIIFQNKALQDADDFYNIYYITLGISSKNAEEYSFIDTEIQKLINENYKLRNKIKIQIISNGDNTNRIKTKIAELLSREGFTVSQTLSEYLATINVNTTTEKSGNVYLAYPQIQIAIEKTDGTTIAHFSKQIEKVSSYTKEAVERLSLNKLETELENNFVNNLLYNKRSE